MADQTVSTPQSSNEANGPKLQKDRNCPFCGQAFTSSSLGRHLDLYIKPKNPKPPDGIHNVEDIKRMRGNITRRQSRISGGGGGGGSGGGSVGGGSRRRDSSTTPGPRSSAPISVAATVTGGSVSLKQLLEKSAATQQPVSPSSLGRFESKMGVRFNRPGWESTGVINDLPPRQEPRPEIRREAPRPHHQILKADLEQRHKIAEELEVGRAAELALQEVLGSVRDASTWYSGRGLFEFDFFAFSFPTLCLRILPAPSTIQSPTPFATRDSWPIDPPTEPQYNALNRAVEDRSLVVKRQWEARPPTPNSTPQNPPQLSDLHKFYAHITDAFDHWNRLSPEEQRQQWQLETLRSFARADQDRKDSENTIALMRKQIEHLGVNLDRVNSGWTPFSSLTPLRLSNDLVRELCKQGVDFRGWDYNRLMDKWKNVVRDEKKAANGLGGQRPLPARDEQTLNTAPHVGLNGHTHGSRSVSLASAFPGLPRTDSMDSEGRENDDDADDDDADGDVDDSITETGADDAHRQRLPSLSRLPHQQTKNSFPWPAQNMSSEPPQRDYYTGITRLPPGPEDWKREVAHAAMEGVEGPGL